MKKIKRYMSNDVKIIILYYAKGWHITQNTKTWLDAYVAKISDIWKYNTLATWYWDLFSSKIHSVSFKVGGECNLREFVT